VILFLACVTITGLSNMVLGIPNPPDPHYSYTDCEIYKSLKEAALAQFERSHTTKIQVPYNKETETTTFYELNVDQGTLLRIKEPKIRIEVDEK